MARPKKSGMDYFAHDTDARNDIKIKKLMAMYGIEGYAVYFILLEIIFRSDGYEVEIEDEDTIAILSDECKIPYERFKKILDKALQLGLFDSELYINNNILTSNGIKKRAYPVEKKRNGDCNRNGEKTVIAAKTEVIESKTPQKPPIIAAISTQSKVNNITPIVPLQGDGLSRRKPAVVESPKLDNKPPFESKRKEMLPTQAVEEVESRVSTSKKESTTNQQDKDSSGMVKNFNKEECLAKLCKLYRTGRNNKTESRKNYFGYLTGTKRDRVDNRLYRYNHIQLYIAAEKYLREQRDVPSDKVKLLSSYLSERVRDDVEATRNEYESEMRKHYGENWKEVRFVYD